MKKIWNLLIMLLSLGAYAQQNSTTTESDFSTNKSENTFEFKGSGFTDYYEGAAIRLHTHDPKNPEEWVFVVADTIRGGAFSLKGKINTPQNALLTVMDNGSPLYLSYMIAEPVQAKMIWDSDYNKLLISKGNYNQKVTVKAEQTPNMLSSYKASNDAELRMQYEQDTVKLNAYYKITENYWTKVKTKYDSIRKFHEDPMARLLALRGSTMIDDAYNGITEEPTKELLALEKEIGLGEIPEIAVLKKEIQLAEKSLKIQNELSIGNNIKDFTAKTIDNKEVRLIDQIEKNSYLLIDFWASWCAPCREENPNMIKMYNRYKGKGFDIVAFSLDKRKEDWENATIEDTIPWVNLSDTIGYKSPIVEKYGIVAIPMNYLVDKTGKIVAQNLRGDELGEKLKELLESN